MGQGQSNNVGCCTIVQQYNLKAKQIEECLCFSSKIYTTLYLQILREKYFMEQQIKDEIGQLLYFEYNAQEMTSEFVVFSFFL